MTTTKTTLYLGLNDKDTKRQEVSTLEAYKMTQALVTRLVGGGTIFEAVGVYTHDDGTIVTEKTLRIELFDAGAEAVRALVSRLKEVFNQESVIAQTEATNTVFL